MARLKLDQDSLGLSSLFERLTKVRVKDCFRSEDTVYFVVAAGDAGKAIGKGAANIKKVQSSLGKKIRVIEYRDNVCSFVKNLIYPLTVEEIVEEDGGVVLRDSNYGIKSKLIGRNHKNLQILNRAVQRFFNKEVKVE